MKMTDGVSLSLQVLRCADLERSRAFYESLGLAFTREQHDRGPLHYSSRVGDTVLELYPKGTLDTSGLRFGLILLRGREVLDALTQCGGALVSTDSRDVRRVVVRDPDGHTLELALS
jgi:lactoylglutathione lyase